MFFVKLMRFAAWNKHYTHTYTNAELLPYHCAADQKEEKRPKLFFFLHCSTISKLACKASELVSTVAVCSLLTPREDLVAGEILWEVLPLQLLFRKIKEPHGWDGIRHSARIRDRIGANTGEARPMDLPHKVLRLGIYWQGPQDQVVEIEPVDCRHLASTGGKTAPQCK